MLRVTVGKSVLNIVSVYAPQVGRSTEEKEEFYGVLGKVLSETSTNESLSSSSSCILFQTTRSISNNYDSYIYI